MFKILAFARLYLRLGILFTHGRQLYDCIISQRGEVWTRDSSLTPPLLIKVPVPSQGTLLYLYVKGIDCASLYDFGIGF